MNFFEQAYPVPGYLGYFVNKQGELFHGDKKIGSLNKKTGYIMACIESNSGKKIQVGVHRLVALTFIENDDPENKLYVNHIDTNRYNNKIDNLEWVTFPENVLHGYRSGNHPDYYDQKFLSLKDVKDIRKSKILNLFSGYYIAEKILDVSPRAYYDITSEHNPRKKGSYEICLKELKMSLELKKIELKEMEEAVNLFEKNELPKIIEKRNKKRKK